MEHRRAEDDLGERILRVLARRPPPVKNACSVCAASWITLSPSIRPGQPRSRSWSRGENMQSFIAGSVCTTTSAISGRSRRISSSIRLASACAAASVSEPSRSVR